jgi:hypothetical protein
VSTKTKQISKKYLRKLLDPAAPTRPTFHFEYLLLDLFSVSAPAEPQLGGFAKMSASPNRHDDHARTGKALKGDQAVQDHRFGMLVSQITERDFS